MQNKKLSFFELFSIGVGGMIGGGIFAVLGLSVMLSGKNAPISFMVAGIVALLTGYSYAKLSKRYPSRGGTTEYLVKAYGTGIFTGALNILLLISYIVMISLYAYAFGAYINAVFSFIHKNIAATLVILAFVVVNAFGSYISGKTEDVLVMFKLSMLMLVVISGFLVLKHIEPFGEIKQNITNIITGGMIIFLAYEGFELIANASTEAKTLNDVGKAFYSSIIFVTTLYVFIAIVTINSLPLKEIINAKDYALAMVAKPILGNIGFLLVDIAALVSTASAINATLFGTSGISYIVSKYGELPKSLSKNVWKNAPEGLIIIAIASILLVNMLNLESISILGSAGFLLIFLMVNLAGFKLRKKAKINPAISLLSIALSFVSLVMLLYENVSSNLFGVEIFVLVIILSFLSEAIYRKLSKREYMLYLDSSLNKREKSILIWDKWLKNVVQKLSKRYPESEVYLVGSLARNEPEKSSDVDILVLSNYPKNEIIEYTRKIAEKHPLDVHAEQIKNREKVFKKNKRYILLYKKKPTE